MNISQPKLRSEKFDDDDDDDNDDDNINNIICSLQINGKEYTVQRPAFTSLKNSREIILHSLRSVRRAGKVL